MNALMILFWQMCMFRVGPDKVPYSRELTLILICMFWCAGLAHLVIFMDLGQAVLYNSLILAIYLAYIYLLLQFYGLGSRFVQTFSALLGTQLVITVVFLFPLMSLGYLLLSANAVNFFTFILSFFYIFAMLAIGIWWVTVASFILGRTLNDNIMLGLFAVIIYKVVEYFILKTFW